MSRVTVTNTQVVLRETRGRILRRAANELRVVQKEQVANAFRDGGQPGMKWKPLWADTFTGKVPWDARGAMINAQSAFFRAMHAKNPDAMRIARAMERVEKTRGKAIAAASYRKGGQPLRDTGALAASFFTKYHFVFEAEGAALIVIASSNFTAEWHQCGFKTKGPNFIPLTLNAKRQHVTGANPEHEGLELGVDYIIAWKGVKIPARPMIDYADPANKKQITDTVTSAIERG